MKKLYLTIVFLFIALSVWSQVNDPGWLRGNWEGTGFQTNNNSTWQVKLDFNYPEKILKVSYPGLNCGGHWKVINDEGKRIEFIEIITDGKTNCIDGSKIVINKIDDSFIHVSWFSKYIEGVDAYAVLNRPLPNWLNGEWTGKGFQTNNNHVWSVDFKFNSSSNEAIISYPSLNCSGKWIMKSNKGYQIVFEEKITNGKSNCIDGSKIIVNRTDENFIGISWFSPHIEGVDAYATLRKK